MPRTDADKAKDFSIFEDEDLKKHSTMLYVPGGTFMMGSNEYEEEKPVHLVQISPFYLGQYPVTQALWKKVLGDNPSHFRGNDRPVERVSWDRITEEFLPALNKIAPREGGKFRLPSEAEWEYAARAGQPELMYAGHRDAPPVAWYEDNSHEETKPVGLKRPNDWDFFELSGNVWEWCADQWHDHYLGAPADGTAWVDRAGGDERVLRGGGWISDALGCRVANRNGDPRAWGVNGNLGFRLAWSLPPKK